MKNYYLLIICLLATGLRSHGQQISDTSFTPQISRPAYPTGKGAVIAIDEGHHNFHTLDGRYLTLAKLLRQDGYIVRKYEGLLDKDKLKQVDILIISNSLNERNAIGNNWSLPTPSAFSKEEIEVVNNWVKNGGRLLLVADHMPFPGAAHGLAASFGIDFQNVFATDKRKRRLDYFTREEGTLKDAPLTKGLDSIVTFGGSAFSITAKSYTPVIVFDDNYQLVYQDTARVFNKNTIIKPATGWLQLAYLQYGKGRIAVSGEAAMFSAQIVVRQNNWPMGFNNPGARNNVPFIRNLFGWLGSGIPHPATPLE
ncbi:MAG: DUF4350 domain-containing protein [Chitinophagaceae bacterium]